MVVGELCGCGWCCGVVAWGSDDMKGVVSKSDEWVIATADEVSVDELILIGKLLGVVE